MLYDTSAINPIYQNLGFTSTMIFLTIINNICKMITFENTNIISKYTKLHNQQRIDNSNMSESMKRNDREIEEYLNTWKPIQIGLGVGSNVMLFLLFIALVCNANIKLLISTMIITIFCITTHQFFNIYDSLDMDMSKTFNFIEMLLFIIISTTILISLFDSMWITLYSILFLIMYIYFLAFNDNKLIEKIQNRGLVMEEYYTFVNKYMNIFDIMNIIAICVFFTLITVFAKNLSLYSKNISKTNLYKGLKQISSSISLPLNQMFYFDENGNIQITDEIKDRSYALMIKESQVVLHTKNAIDGIPIGTYVNNKINLPISKYVRIDIQTAFQNGKWFSDIIDKQIRFNDGTMTIMGPQENEFIDISIDKQYLHTFNIEDSFIPMPCGDYQLDSTLSKLANQSSFNKISLDIYNSLDNKCDIYQIYYPETDILLGEGKFDEFPCIWLDLKANIDGQPIFQLLNGNIMYLSPMAKQYVHIDSTFNLNNGRIFFKFT